MKRQSGGVIILLSAIFICFAAISAFADQNSDARRAAALLSDGKNEEAYQIYIALFRADPDNVTLAYRLARSALLTNRPNQAIAAFEHLIGKDPDNTSYIDGLTRAYTALGDKETAEAYISTQGVTSSSRFEVHGGLRVGGIFDSNANLGPASNYLRLGNYLVTLNNAKQIESYGAYIGGNIDAAYRLSPNSPWHLAGDATVYARYNFNDKLKDIDRDSSEWYRAALGIKGVFSTRLLDFRVKSEIYDNSFYQTIYTYGAELSFLQALRYRYHFITALSGDKRDYVRNENYNGTYLYAGEYFRAYFGKALHSVTLGGRYSLGEADYENFSYTGWEALISGRFNLPYGWILSPQASYGTENYKGAATVLETEKREDKRWTAGITIQYSITEHFSAQVVYQYISNSSNSGIYDYTRHTGNLGLDWKF